MAGVDFGASELFEQLDGTLHTPVHTRFTDEDEGVDETCIMKSRLGEYEETNRSLLEENEALKRKISILTRPSGIVVENDKMDGPLLQILYANNSISKQCRQEIEDCIGSVIQRHQQQGIKNNPSFQMKPQPSAFVLEEGPDSNNSRSNEISNEAFNVVGSVLYFSAFCVDKLGQPLLNENPQLTNGWVVPTYQQVFNQVIASEGQEVEIKEKRPKNICFNCGSESHQLRQCPQPKDMAAINERRKEFSQGNQMSPSSQRYHTEEVEERFAKYKPGIISEELMTALGVAANALSPVIYRMRQLGYPPGWLKEAELETSGLTLYDGNMPPDGDVEDGNQVSYDVSKLVEFPGFNVPAPPKTKDEHMLHGSIPMQFNHMKQNFSAYLSKQFPKPGATRGKRQHESDPQHQHNKRRKSSPEKSSDMEMDSDLGTPQRHSSEGFQFLSPLPPGSPSFGSPPPLPHGTPPATPTPPPLPKGTPPRTPSNGSPALSGRALDATDDSAASLEDGLTLEELEEQQRLLWAALENADTATNSDSETPVTGTPVPSSPSVSTSAHNETETEMEDAEVDADSKGSTPSAIHNGEKQGEFLLSMDGESNSLVSPSLGKTKEDNQQSTSPIRAEEDNMQSSSPIRAEDDNMQSSGPIRAEDDNMQSSGPIRAEEDNIQSSGPIRAEEDNMQSSGPIRAEEDKPQSPGPVRPEEEIPRSPDPVIAQHEGLQSSGPVKAQESCPQIHDSNMTQAKKLMRTVPIQAWNDSPESPQPDKTQDDSPQSPDFANTEKDIDENSSMTRITAVPHRSRFAAGIVPFEDTPEFTEVAEATGTYLRIRDLLKSSPRNATRNKK